MAACWLFGCPGSDEIPERSQETHLKFTIADIVKNSIGILFCNEKCNCQSFSPFRQISLGSQIRSSWFTQWARILSKGRVSSCTHLPVEIPADTHSCGLGYPLPSDALGALCHSCFYTVAWLVTLLDLLLPSALSLLSLPRQWHSLGWLLTSTLIMLVFEFNNTEV